jgi:GGDEF domain-containing protein
MPQPWIAQLEDLLDAELVRGTPDNPFRPAVLRWAAAAGRDADPGPLLTRLEEQAAADRGGRGFRWQLPVGRWIPLDRLQRWRPAEAELAERNPNDHANRLWRPIVLVEHLAWLEEVAAGSDERGAGRARVVLARVLPSAEDLVAQTITGTDTWADNFLLWSFVRTPRALEPLRGLVSALASRYVLRASRTGSLVHGRAFPFYGASMPSATAHLATASAILGEGVGLVEGQLSYLARERRPDRGWGDPGQPSDLLATLAAARLLGSIDPSFDPATTVEPLGAQAVSSGPRPCLIGPEWPWVAAELWRFLRWSEEPFTDRFQWPNVPRAQMDDKTTLPWLDGYFTVADLFTAVSALGSQPVEVAFLDLANFGAWNKDHGQDAGDDLLRLLARQLRALPSSRAYRDGGDEFLAVGSPGTTTLEEAMRLMSASWPAESRRAFPGLPVVPIRAVVTRTGADGLRAARVELGKAVGPLKAANLAPPEWGVVERLGG